MDKKRITLIPNLGKKNKNGRIYSEELANEIINNNKELFGQIGHPDNAYVDDLTKLSHKVKNFTIENNSLVGDVEYLETPPGHNARVSLPALGWVCRPRGYGSVDEDGNISDYKIIAFDLIEKSTDSFE